MTILFDILHPAHVHLFKNSIRILQKKGHTVVITARDKDVTVDLLDAYGFEYYLVSKHRRGIVWLAYELVVRTIKIFFILVSKRPAIMVAAAGVSVGFLSFITRIPNVQFHDTESAGLQNKISYPFATRLFTQRAYRSRVSDKHETYDGYKELAWLAPQYFTPQPLVLEKLGITSNDRYCVVRFVAFGAAHDTHVQGFSDAQKIELVQRLEQYGKVFISAEGTIPEILQPYVLDTNPEDIHHVLYYSSLVVGESATMISEAAVLGVPAVFVYSYSLGYLEEQSARYGLVHHFLSNHAGQRAAIETSIRLFIDTEAKKTTQQNRQKMLDESIDVTQFIVEKIVQYAKNKK